MIRENNYRRNASLARSPPPAAFALTFGKNISCNDDRFDDYGGEDVDDDDKVDNLNVLRISMITTKTNQKFNSSPCCQSNHCRNHEPSGHPDII